jgi:ribonuclease PH
MFKRLSNRNFDELRNISLEANFSPYAEGSCFAKFGKTHVLCTASVESKLPLWLRNSGKGWITAEYGMLPRSTHSRMDREVTKGKPSGRTQEIQRLIGRSLRSVVDLGKLSEFQIKIDCDVIQADGGTRTASITGAWVALHQAINFLLKSGKLSENPIIDQVAAISCGICENQELIDLDYEEDSSAETDGNFVMSSNNGIVEIQTTAEEKPFNKEQFLRLLNLAELGTKNIFRIQKDALGLN